MPYADRSGAEGAGEGRLFFPPERLGGGARHAHRVPGCLHRGFARHGARYAPHVPSERGNALLYGMATCRLRSTTRRYATAGWLVDRLSRKIGSDTSRCIRSHHAIATRTHSPDAEVSRGYFCLVDRAIQDHRLPKRAVRSRVAETVRGNRVFYEAVDCKRYLQSRAPASQCPVVLGALAPRRAGAELELAAYAKLVSTRWPPAQMTGECCWP